MSASRLAALIEVDRGVRDEPAWSSLTVAGIAISVEDDPPPVVRSIARDLAACLEDGSFAHATWRARGVVSVRSAVTPQAVTLRISGGAIAIRHGAADDADATAIAELTRSGDAAPRIECSGEHPELSEWLSALLRPPTPPPPEAAAHFWEVLSGMPGAPSALLVVNLDEGEERRFGLEEHPAWEIHGTTDGLLAVLTGRASLMDAAFEGTVYVHGTFPALSVLSGAGFAIRYGTLAADG